jgi:hypothetical protein
LSLVGAGLVVNRLLFFYFFSAEGERRLSAVNYPRCDRMVGNVYVCDVVGLRLVNCPRHRTLLER